MERQAKASTHSRQVPGPCYFGQPIWGAAFFTGWFAHGNVWSIRNTLVPGGQYGCKIDVRVDRLWISEQKLIVHLLLLSGLITFSIKKGFPSREIWSFLPGPDEHFRDLLARIHLGQTYAHPDFKVAKIMDAHGTWTIAEAIPRFSQYQTYYFSTNFPGPPALQSSFLNVCSKVIVLGSSSVCLHSVELVKLSFGEDLWVIFMLPREGTWPGRLEFLDAFTLSCHNFSPASSTLSGTRSILFRHSDPVF